MSSTILLGGLKKNVEDGLIPLRKGSPDGIPMVPHRAYVSIELIEWKLERRWGSRYPCIHFSGAFMASNGERAEQRMLVSPQFLGTIVKQNLGRVKQGKQVALGPMPFRGDLKLEFGLFSNPENGSLDHFLTMMDEISALASVPYISPALPFARLLKTGIGNLFGVSDHKALEIGLSLDVLSDTPTGLYMLARNIPNNADLYFDLDAGSLVNKGSKSLRDAAYVIFEIKASERRHDWFSAPDIANAWSDVRFSGQSNDQVSFEQSVSRFQRAALTSLDLLPEQARELSELAEVIRDEAAGTFGQYENSAASIGFDPGPLESFESLFHHSDGIDEGYESFGPDLLSALKQRRSRILGMNRLVVRAASEVSSFAGKVHASVQSFEMAYTFVKKWEGGFVDNPNDPGGRTNFGVTQKTYDRWRAQNGLPEHDVKLISQKDVRDIFIKNYWLPAQCDKVPLAIALLIFDSAVNCGVRRAKKMVQRALGLKEDGVFGPITFAALPNTSDSQREFVDFAGAFLAVRSNFYHAIVRRRPSSVEFLRGWLRRVEDLGNEVDRLINDGNYEAVDEFSFAVIPTMRFPDLEPDMPLEAVVEIGDDYEFEAVADDNMSVRLADLKLRAEEILDMDDSLFAHSMAIALAEDVLRMPSDVVGDGVLKTLDLLKSLRLFESLHTVSSEFELSGWSSFDVIIYRAQALVELGLYGEAMTIIRRLLHSESLTLQSLSECKGLLARANKQLFIESVEAEETDRVFLNEAIKINLEAFEESARRNLWHAVQIITLSARSRMDGFPYPGVEIEQLAEEILRKAEDGLEIEKGTERTWLLANILHASAVLEDWSKAQKAADEFIDAGATDFMISGTIRQLTEILKFDLCEADLPQRDILRRLKLAQLMSSSATEIDFYESDLSQLSADKLSMPKITTGYERSFGGSFGTFEEWVTRLIEIGRGTVEISSMQHNFKGTGFLVDGGQLSEKWHGKDVIITNEHVINEDGSRGALKPKGARLRFTESDESNKLIPDTLLWSSPREAHDISILEVTGVPADAKKIAVEDSCLLADGSVRSVTVIGHPAGRKLSISIENLKLLAHEALLEQEKGFPVRLHYRADTMGGSSGSPVFDWQSLAIIGVHHKGGHLPEIKTSRNPGPKIRRGRGSHLRRKHNPSKKILTNEGISISSIKEAILMYPNGWTEKGIV